MMFNVTCAGLESFLVEFHAGVEEATGAVAAQERYAQHIQAQKQAIKGQGKSMMAQFQPGQ